MTATADKLHELPALRNRTQVFCDRRHAGLILADMLVHDLPQDALLFAIPAGGVPVAAALAERLQRSLDVAVVSKITLPWNTEAGYGAVAFDGTVELNTALIAHLGLAPAQVEQGIQTTHDKVRRRLTRLRGEQPFPTLTDIPAVLVDDGLASGYTMRCAIRALRHAGATALSVAVPTAHATAAEAIVREVTALYCANIREGYSFAVADAYAQWSDVTEQEAIALLTATRHRAAFAPPQNRDEAP